MVQACLRRSKTVAKQTIICPSCDSTCSSRTKPTDTATLSRETWWNRPNSWWCMQQGENHQQLKECLTESSMNSKITNLPNCEEIRRDANLERMRPLIVRWNRETKVQTKRMIDHQEEIIRQVSFPLDQIIRCHSHHWSTSLTHTWPQTKLLPQCQTCQTCLIGHPSVCLSQRTVEWRPPNRYVDLNKYTQDTMHSMWTTGTLRQSGNWCHLQLEQPIKTGQRNTNTWRMGIAYARLKQAIFCLSAPSGRTRWIWTIYYWSIHHLRLCITAFQNPQSQLCHLKLCLQNNDVLLSDMSISLISSHITSSACQGQISSDCMK